MDSRGALIRSFGKSFYGVLLRVGVPLLSPLGGKADEVGQPRRPAERLDVLVKNLIGGKARRRLPKRYFIGIFRRRRAVHLHQTWRDLGAIVAAMAGVACHNAPS